MVRVVGGWLVGLWGMWSRIVAMGCVGYVVVMVVGDRGCGNLVVETVGECGSLAEVVVVGLH
jgi:hypothetical protein